MQSMKAIVFFAFLFISFTTLAQPTREALERQRNELKKEIEQTEKLLASNKNKTNENLLQWRLINNKVNLQDRVVDNINKDIRTLNNNIYLIQKDINKYDRILDTLKQEYAKSMVYAYKNRTSYDILNFIFAANSFNDAIKRVSYLKSYRTYREMQGQNILRTQEVRKQRIADLSNSKKTRTKTLQDQSKELEVLAREKKEKDRILAELKKQGKQLNNQIAAKQRQMKKVNSAIAAAIKKAQDDARREAMARAAEEERKRKAEEAAAAKEKTTTGSVAAAPKKAAEPVKRESVLLNADNVALNSSFEKNKGTLPWPVDRGTVLMHYGNNQLPSGSTINVTSVTVAADVGSPVKAIFDGEVSTVQTVEDMQVVIIQHGRYFSTYSNLSGVTVSRGQNVKTGQTIGRVAVNFDGIGAIDFFMSNEKSNFDPEQWLRRR